MSDEERRIVETTLARESALPSAKTSVAATNAFGMGMDFPQFTWAVLSHIPFSLLALMQAFGRVGRGGKAGEAILYWSEEDFRFAGLLLGGGPDSNDDHEELARLRRYVEGNEIERRAIESEIFM